MAVNSSTTNSFTNAFMRGFSFVDDINNRRKAQDKLDQRLAEERAQRERQNARQDVADQRASTLFEQSQQDRAQTKEEIELGRQGDKLLLSGNASREDLLKFAPYSQNVANRLAKLNREDELISAQQELAGTQGAQPGGLSDQVSTANGESLLAPSRGQNSFEQVDASQLGLSGGVKSFQSVGNNVSGSEPGLPPWMASASQAGTPGNNISGSESGLPPWMASADQVTRESSDISVPSDYTTEQEFAQIEDPAEFEQARARNDQIIQNIKLRGDSGEQNQSELAQLKEGNRMMRMEAQRIEAATEAKYANFTDPNSDSQIRSLAAEDPHAASIQYFTDRATLKSANPQLATQMDKSMQPVIKSAATELKAKLSELPSGRPEYARAVRDLRNIQATQSQMNRDFSISDAAGINDDGLPLGNAKLSGQVADVARDPDRPRRGTPPSGNEIRSAVTTTNRMSNTRRASESQLRAAIRLVDAGLATPEDLTTLTMTGKWPDGSAAAKINSGKPGDVLWGTDENGNVQVLGVLPGGKDSGSGGRGKDGKIGLNQFTEKNLDGFIRGVTIEFPGDDEGSVEYRNQMEKTFLRMGDYLEERVDLSDPLAAQKLGQTFAQAMHLSIAEDNWLFNVIETNLGGEAPTFEQILRSPALAARLSVEHTLPFTLVLDPRMDGVEVNNLRQELAIEGKYRPELQMAAETMPDEEFVLTVARYDYLTEQ